MKVFLNWLSEYKEVQLSVRSESIRSVKIRDRTPKAIDNDIIASVIRMARHDQDRLMITTMYESGVRINELVNLRVSDLVHNDLHVRGKGSVERWVCITPELATALRKQAQDGREWLFINTYGGYNEQMTKGTARLRVQRCFSRKAGIHMTPHQLRHSFAINLLQNGCDIVTIQRLLGHDDITTTQVYLRVSNEYIRGEYTKYIGKSALVY